jgi:aminoglycoside 6'-N-acetyltransferase
MPIALLDPELDAELVRIVRSPAVAAWWSDPTEDEDGWPRGEDTHQRYAIFAGETLVGGIAWWTVDNTHYEHAGMDLFIDGSAHGRGIGRRAVHLMARELFGRGHHRLVIDPAARNEVAIRCYASVGFSPVGVMRRYEWAAEGGWQDGLMMDCLPEDLRDPDVVRGIRQPS